MDRILRVYRRKVLGPGFNSMSPEEEQERRL